ncbi:MAG: phosphoribulokinase [Gammaproteobacteria bacterium]|nr:phosphoribulokinase [Gammaproteobacteria bacterium]
MSDLHPIVAVTGSSGAGTSSAAHLFERLFRQLAIEVALIEGDSFHRYDRFEMQAQVARAATRGEDLTHFGPGGNLFAELEALFSGYAAHGTGRRRHYVHTERDAEMHGQPVGTLTPWQPLPPDTDLLLYEGLHGGLVTGTIDIASQVDLLIGVVPIINLEWIQKIHRDRAVRGYSAEDATQAILRRMADYVHYICPQFSRTDVNFQRVPLIDTSNPFVADVIPGGEECLLVIHLRNQARLGIGAGQLRRSLSGARLSGPDTLHVPATEYQRAVELVCGPAIERLIQRRRALRR